MKWPTGLNVVPEFFRFVPVLDEERSWILILPFLGKFGSPFQKQDAQPLPGQSTGERSSAHSCTDDDYVVPSHQESPNASTIASVVCIA